MTRRHLFWPVLAVLALFAPLAAHAFETSAKEAILLDESTGTVLFEKNADVITYPSSMTKLMTVYLIFERLADGTLSLDDTLPVSEKAWRLGGSKMFVEVGTRVNIEDLIRGIIVQSGNDATVVVAEGLAGSEDAFAREMTDKARELGMFSTSFRNASGWPNPQHVTTVRDLSILARATIKNFPQFYHYYSETEFTFSDITQSNRNPLLYAGIGGDGLKTGHTEAAGYGLVGSAIQGDRRLIVVVNDLGTSADRASESQRILEWGFREFSTYDLFAAGETVEEAEVWLGAENTVSLVLSEPLSLTLSRDDRRDMKVRVVYDGPIPAPIAAGTPIASLIIEGTDMVPVERTLLAGTDVGELSFLSHLGASMGYLVFGPSSSTP